MPFSGGFAAQKPEKRLDTQNLKHLSKRVSKKEKQEKSHFQTLLPFEGFEEKNVKPEALGQVSPIYC
ncbi:hypothetical protein MSSIH_3607 [Methanosarcina siciliae HI350]|uniref:Uncharacterized protein n=1 Tax=Methanosarcina siciliae HI350 TaxID=1434119 RepID=A0A0E3PJ90_9EURY|nr:hypothetical protein MSSIH_3607 [Methanosarcina siciliae HI350]